MSQPLKPYVLFPGTVQSRTDGDSHFIDSVQLMRLYLLTPDECQVVFSPASHAWWWHLSQEQRNSVTQIHPRADGDYPCFKRS